MGQRTSFDHLWWVIAVELHLLYLVSDFCMLSDSDLQETNT